MPQSRNSETPPKVMTWSKASLVLIVAGIFDLVRAFFNFFWFLGPALAALFCTAYASGALSSWTFGLLGVKTAAVACFAGAGAIGVAGIEATAPFGVIMADAFGLLGFLIIGLWILMTNGRIVKTASSAPIQFAAAFALSEVPLLGALPFLTLSLWRLYHVQIQIETAALKKWQEGNAAQLQQRRQQATQIMQGQQAQQVAQAEQQEAVNDEMPAEMEQEKKPREVINEKRYKPLPTRVIPRLATVPNYTGTTQKAANDDQYTQKKVA